VAVIYAYSSSLIAVVCVRLVGRSRWLLKVGLFGGLACSLLLLPKYEIDSILSILDGSLVLILKSLLGILASLHSF